MDSQHSSTDAQDRVVLLLDLDCFYASCERRRLGLPLDCCLALLQWDSCLAVSYPAREYGIKRGDGFQAVHDKSKGKCMAVHVPILDTEGQGVDFDGNFESIYELSTEEQERLRAQDIGRRRYASEGKACLERYRVASRKIFELVMESMSNDQPHQATKPVLEKASIDEFFIDSTAVCSDPSHPLWSKILQFFKNSSKDSGEEDGAKNFHKTIVVGLNQENPTDAENSLKSNAPFDRGCQLAYYIRQYVFEKVGFTLTAGVSTNKMIAKLSASYGKPNGQAVVLPHLVKCVLHNTELSKVRNFGGKLGKALIELLPSDAPETMGSIAKYLSMPQLQNKFGLETAEMVFNACRGYCNEPVEPKNSGNIVKSITAFKSLPRSLDADIEEASFVKWLHLLVQEVVLRVETDCQRNQRYPRNCTIHYGCHGQLNSAGKLDMKSFRIPFPPKRLEVAHRISQLMERIPKKIIEREVPAVKGRTRNKIRIVRAGVCATEMRESVGKHGSIVNYFSAASAKVWPTRNQSKSEPTPKKENKANADVQSPENTSCNNIHSKSRANASPDETLQPSLDHATSSVECSDEEPAREVGELESKDLQMARELQASFDREKITLDRLDKISSDRPLKNFFPGKHAIAEKSNASGQRGCVYLPGKKSAPEDKDLKLARKLQATYDREDKILGQWETTKRRGSLSSREKHGAKKKAKTKKISTFFSISK